MRRLVGRVEEALRRGPTLLGARPSRPLTSPTHPAADAGETPALPGAPGLEDSTRPTRPEPRSPPAWSRRGGRGDASIKTANPPISAAVLVLTRPADRVCPSPHYRTRVAEQRSCGPRTRFGGTSAATPPEGGSRMRGGTSRAWVLWVGLAAGLTGCVGTNTDKVQGRSQIGED